MAILLICSWDIYRHCQNEAILPIIAWAILLSSFLMRLGSNDKQFKLFERIPLFAIILISLAIGHVFRSSLPLPEGAVSPFPELTAAAQSATIIAALFLWLKPFKPSNLYLILFMAWLTVTLSINVPYSPSLFFKFSLFCLLSIVVIIANTSRKPKNRKYILTYYRDFICFSVILVAMTIVLFFGISRIAIFLDYAFINAMNDYILPRHYTHFLNINSKLNLITPGQSAFDRRPVLEVSVPKVQGVYLRTQVFKDFDNGVWEEQQDLKYTTVANRLVEKDAEILLTMFTPLKDIVPSPPGITGVQGPGLYEKDENQIVYGKEQRPTRVLKFSVEKRIIPTQLEASELQAYTKIPDDIAVPLKELSSQIVGDETNPIKKARLISDFFHTGFDYSLDVNFRADNEGLIAMIKEKRPAYCTYFATAMSLLLRAQGIPSRVATGFFTTEVMDRRQNRFLARVRHAHAWVEVLFPVDDPSIKQKIMMWDGFDPTPPGAVSAAPGRKTLFDFDRFNEQLWLGLLRFSVHLQNIDKEKAKASVLYTLVTMMLLMNAKNIFLGLKRWLTQSRKRPKTIKPPGQLQLIYRRYEQYLKKSFGETRRLTETDYDVVGRLKKRPDIPEESITKVESFLRHYHAARFGEKEDVRLEEMR